MSNQATEAQLHANRDLGQVVSQMARKYGDRKFGIWTDPNGCFHYTAERGDSTWLEPLLETDGEPICE